MAGKRVLLMHISKISGHYVAALAIEKAIKIIDPAAYIMPMDAFEYTNPRSEKIVNAVYMALIQKMPFLWNYLYDNPSWLKRTAGLKSSIHRRNFPKLDKLFSDCKPDVVVCTQAYPCGMVADYKKFRNINIPLVGVLTDYVPHSYWVYDNVDYYITPSEEVMERLIKKGVGPQRIKPLGIPFDPKFSRTLDKEEMRRKLGLSSMFTVLVMGGGQGLGPIKTVVRALDKADAAFQVAVVCGTNKKVYDSLKKISPSFRKKILLLGYCNNIDELMSASDVIVSKPGGVTVAEALCKGCAMIIVDPLPGQELNNVNYLTARAAAIKVDDPSKAGDAVKALCDDAAQLQRLSQAARAISKPNAAIDIAKLVLGL
jgi:processive 1,2-diacylglycerol beta-glucosyltransferase